MPADSKTKLLWSAFEEFAKKAVSVSEGIVITPLVTTDSQKAEYTEEK